MVVLCPVAQLAGNFQSAHVRERFVENQKIVVRQAGKLYGLRARAGVDDDVPVLLKNAFQRSAHPVVTAGYQDEWRPFRGQFHPASSSVARLAWRLSTL